MAKTEEQKEPRAYAAGVPVYCTYDKIVPIGELKPNPKNPNRHPTEQIEALGNIIRGSGWRNNITVSTRSGLIVKGHGRLLAAQLEELTEVPVEFQSYGSEADELADMTADNRLAELAETDDAALAAALGEIDAAGLDLALSGYSEDEYREIAGALSAALGDDEEEEGEDPDIVVETPAEPVSQRGDIWILDGRHRVMCGDSRSKNDTTALFDGAVPQILLTDPPYCSGGYQEAARTVGSIGTDRKGGNPTIANDTLSTRGYQSLMKNALENVPALVSYIFTDWRMWINLFDVVEAAGFGVRNMIVWNKKTPGMGNGWRTQHELIMYGQRTKAKWDNHKGYGNVIELSRSGNEFHPTQKPVELIEILLDNTEWLEGVYDPFAGSGTTLVAAENKGQQAFCMELTPGYTDTIVRRYMKVTGSRDVRCIRNGKPLPKREMERIFEETEAAGSDEGGGKG